MDAVGAGTPYPVIGARGEVDGFRRIARPTIPEGGLRTVAGGVRTLAMAAGARRGRPTGDGKVHTAAGSIRSRLGRSPRYPRPGLLIGYRLWPLEGPPQSVAIDLRSCWLASAHRLIGAERAEAVATQRGIFDWPALLSHAGAAKSSIGAEEVVVRLALPQVLGLSAYATKMGRSLDPAR